MGTGIIFPLNLRFLIGSLSKVLFEGQAERDKNVMIVESLCGYDELPCRVDRDIVNEIAWILDRYIIKGITNGEYRSSIGGNQGYQ